MILEFSENLIGDKQGWTCRLLLSRLLNAIFAHAKGMNGFSY